MIRAALTGGMATGKSYVLERLARRGLPTIDADRLAREALAPGTPGAAEVARRFPAVVSASGVVDRKALADLVYADLQARRDLEAIVHPRVYHAIGDWLASRPVGTRAAVADIPLLFETGRQDDFDVVIVVACDAEAQVHRVVGRDGLDEADARRRLSAQWPIDEKVRQADEVIWTTGSLADTDAQADRLAERLLNGDVRRRSV